MNTDINGTLLRHQATGAGAASMLRQKRPLIVGKAQAFFDARTDIGRLHAAQVVAEEILLKNDLNDMVEIRDIVARQELNRQIKYGKQQDHTAHTVYLYFLGLWLYDNLPQIANAFGAILGSTTAASRDRDFLLHWLYASLLHDIGYAFHNLADETKEDRRLLDRVFSFAWVSHQYTQLSGSAKAALRRAVDAWDKTYGQHMPAPTASYGQDSYDEVLKRLSHGPWLGDLAPCFKGKDVFEVLDSDGKGLRKYAEEVAQTGYGGDGRCVDHAVASGLFLFQYTTFWYWLMRHIEHTSNEVYKQLAGTFNYSPQNLTKHFVPACRAVAFHNIQQNTKAGKAIIPGLGLDAEPITFLAILCDELQVWDRSPAGWMHLTAYRIFAEEALESSDIELLCNGTREDPKAVFVMRAKGRAANPKQYVKAFRKKLAKRLPEYSRVLEFEIHEVA